MKVKELIEKLKVLNPELNLICYCENAGALPAKQSHLPFEIDSVDEVDAEQIRSKDGIPYLKFGKTKNSVHIVLIEINSDF